MVPSPRKRAPRAAFDQTWDDADAALLDPSSLPVARIPRGWERKQEVKKTEEGKDRKIWRRFNLRSRAENTTEEVDEQEHDVRSRAVKKQQHMSPEAMEKISTKPNGKKRAFKATRWDRRKSVLPSTELEITLQGSILIT
jgi:macrodomain Ter protein organizer (MatP/YcbG family)